MPQGMRPMPEPFELTAADILAGFFNNDVKFIPVSSDKTPDIIIGNEKWEIKSPVGKGKNNIKHQLYRAMRQSKNIVIDARRSKDDVRRIRNRLKYEAKTAKTLRRLLLITKEGKVEVLK
jgi:hypothetical protein